MSRKNVATVCGWVLIAAEIRAAEPDENSPSGWRVNAWVKQGILLCFRIGRMQEIDVKHWKFFDKDNCSRSKIFRSNKIIRIVPVDRRARWRVSRTGCHHDAPAYVNIGAYVGAGTMIDSHALVGSCAQVGERVTY